MLTYEERGERSGNVLFGELSQDEESLEVLQECARVDGLGKVMVVISRQTVVFDDALENVLHVTVSGHCRLVIA